MRIIWLIWMLLPSCATFITGETAKTAGKGRMTGFAGLSVQKNTEKKEDKSKEVTDLSSIDGAVRFGLTDSIDIGARGGAGLGMAELKAGIFESGVFNSALGFGLGVLQYKVETTKDDGEKTTQEQNGRVSHITLHNSIDLGPAAAIYISPRYIYIHQESRTDSSTSKDPEDGDTEKDSSRFGGMTIGLQAGKPLGFFGEATFFSDLDKHSDIKGTQFGFGVTFASFSN